MLLRLCTFPYADLLMNQLQLCGVHMRGGGNQLLLSNARTSCAAPISSG